MHDPVGRTRRAAPRVLLTLGLLLPPVAAAAAPEAAPTGWRSSTQGLEIRGLSSLRFSGKGETWYASVHGRGVCVSTDHGKTWKAINEGLAPKVSDRDRHRIALDPKDEKVLYDVVHGKIYKSTDAGAHWAFKGNGTATFSFDRRHSREWIAGVAVDPSKPLHLLAGTRTRGYYGGLFESANGGESWTQIAGTGDKKLEESGLSHDAWPISLDPRSDKFLVVGGAHGSAWTSEDRGRRFKRTDPGGPGMHTTYALTQIRGREVLLAEGRGLFRSRDAGNKWGDVLLPGTCIAVDDDPSNPKRVYAIVQGVGLFHTEDVAKWDPKSGKHLEKDPHDVVCHPRTKNTVYLTSETTGLWESTDRGETFNAVAGDLPAVVPAITLVAAHPKDSKRMLALEEHGSAFLSQDGGATWAKVGNLGVPASRLLGDPAAPTSWLAAGPGLYASADSGATWTTLKAPADPEDRIVDVQLVSDGLLVLWERDGRVETSKGGTWQAPSTRPASGKGSWGAALAVDAQDPKHWIVAMRTVQETWTKDDAEGGAYETTDAGATWTKLPVAAGVEDGNRGTVAAIDETGAAWYGADGGGLYRRDAAKDAPWVDVTPTSIAKPWGFRAFLVAGSGGGVVEAVLQAESAGSEVRSLVRSNDGGRTWTAMEDPGARLGSLSVDPSTPGRYLAGDVSGSRGVLLYGAAGAAPPTPAGPTPPAPASGAQAPGGPKPFVAATASADGSGGVFDVRAGRSIATLAGHKGELLSVALAPDGARAFTGGADRTVGVWDAAGANQAFLRGAEGAVTALAVSPDGTRLYAGDNQWSIAIWDLAASKEVGRLAGHAGAVSALRVSADGARLVSGSADGTARIWDLASAKEVGRATGHDGGVLAVALSPDGATLYTGSRSPTIRTFDAATGAAKGAFDAGLPLVLALAVSADGALLYAGGSGGDVQVLGAADGKPTGKLTGAGAAVNALALSPDGTSVVAGCADGALRVWTVGQEAPTWSSPAHKGAIYAVALAAAPAGAEPAAPAPPPAPPGPDPAPAPGPEPAPEPPPPGPAPSNPPAMK